MSDGFQHVQRNPYLSVHQNPLVRFVVIAVAAVMAVALVVALVLGAISIFGFLLFIVLMSVSIYFGSIRVMTGSALLVVLLKLFGSTIKALLAVWFAGPRLDNLFKIVDHTGYFDLIFASFFLFYLVSFGTGCIRPHLVTVDTTVNNKKADD